MDYFQFYNIPFNLIIDQDQLRKIYLDYSKKYHPDVHTLSSSTDQDDMLELSSLNNKAYATLKNHQLRLKYILDLKGLLKDGQDNLPPTFLMEMMEVNEQLVDLQLEPTENRLNQIKTLVDTYAKSIQAPIQDILVSVSLTEKDLEVLKTYYLKSRYLSRINEKLDKFVQQTLT